MTKGRAVTGGMTVLVLACLLFACGRSADPLAEDVRLLQRSTTSTGAQISNVIPRERGASSAESSWELLTSMGWEEYLTALRQAMPPEYKLESSGDERCSFVRHLPADTLRLHVEVVARSSPLRLRAKFLAQPW
jgi:hypothetical protein